MEKYKHLQRNVDQWFVFAAIRCRTFHLLVKYRQRTVDTNTSEKSLVMVTIRHRKFHLYVQLLHTKISYLRKKTDLRKDAAFLHFRKTKILFFMQ